MEILPIVALVLSISALFFAVVASAMLLLQREYNISWYLWLFIIAAVSLAVGGAVAETAHLALGTNTKTATLSI